jgi:hypothetical protein
MHKVTNCDSHSSCHVSFGFDEDDEEEEEEEDDDDEFC